MDQLDEWGLPSRIKIDYTQKNHGVVYKYILGSAYAASFVEFIIFFAITIIWFVIFDFAIEPAFPTLFPISNVFQVAVFFVITFVATFYISFEHNLYAGMLRLFARVLGNTNTLAMELCASLRSDTLSKDAQQYFQYKDKDGDVVTSSVQLKIVYRDLNEILRSLVLAQRFEHRTIMKKHREKITGSQIDMANTTSDLDVTKLPMSEHLITEILRYQYDEKTTSGIADQMWNMVYARLHVLANLQGESALISQTMMMSMDRQMSSLTTDTAEIISNKWVGTVPLLVYFLRVSIYLWCFAFAWLLWGDYSWIGLIAATLVLWTMLALWRVGVKLADPFASWNKSRWIWADMTRRAVDTAKEIDEVFDRLFERLAERKEGKTRRTRRPKQLYTKARYMLYPNFY
jgi:hypothetical protein